MEIKENIYYIEVLNTRTDNVVVYHALEYPEAWRPEWGKNGFRFEDDCGKKCVLTLAESDRVMISVKQKYQSSPWEK